MSQISKWVMRQEAFDEMLCWLSSDREEAGKIYEQVRAGLLKFFESNACPQFEEFTDETIQRVTRKIHDDSIHRPDNPYSYFLGVARNILREYWKSKERRVSSIEDLPLSLHPSNIASETDRNIKEKQQLEEDLECLEHCLKELPPESASLFIEYHKGELRARIDNRNRLANMLNISLTSLRTRVCRIGDKLENCINECKKKLEQEISKRGLRR